MLAATTMSALSPVTPATTTTTTTTTTSSPSRSSGCVSQLSSDCSNYEHHSFPLFTKPNVEFSFSINTDRQVINDRCNLRFLSDNIKRKEESLFDLESNRNSALNLDTEREEEHLSLLLTAILANIECVVDKGRDNRLRADFVCFRGLLTKILTSPYERDEGLRVVATKWNGSIFMMAYESLDEKRDRRQSRQRGAHCVYWGYKFEQYMMADEPRGKADTQRAVDANEEFCCVFSSHLGSHSLLYGAEMDGIDLMFEEKKKLDKEELDLNKDVDFVELKTSREVEHPRQLHNFQRRKLLKWWAQSFLVGIQRIICGFRDDEGKVYSDGVREMSVKRIHSDCRGLWSGTVCMSFLNDFLDLVKKSFNNMDDLVVNSFVFDPKRHRVEVFHNDSDLDPDSIVPRWFREKEKWPQFLTNSKLILHKQE